MLQEKPTHLRTLPANRHTRRSLLRMTIPLPFLLSVCFLPLSFAGETVRLRLFNHVSRPIVFTYEENPGKVYVPILGALLSAPRMKTMELASGTAFWIFKRKEEVLTVWQLRVPQDGDGISYAEIREDEMEIGWAKTKKFRRGRKLEGEDEIDAYFRQHSLSIEEVRECFEGTPGSIA